MSLKCISIGEKLKMSHYFIADESLKENKEKFHYEFHNHKIKLESNSGMFSPGHVDFATDILLNNLPSIDGSLLDLGCGYGIIGIALSKINNLTKVTMADTNPRALEYAKLNCVANGVEAEYIETDCFSNITDKYDSIIINPPIHAGKKVIFDMYEGSFNHLNEKGYLYIVIQKKHGAESTMKELDKIFGNCSAIYKKKGFYILACQK